MASNEVAAPGLVSATRFDGNNFRVWIHTPGVPPYATEANIPAVSSNGRLFSAATYFFPAFTSIFGEVRASLDGSQIGAKIAREKRERKQRTRKPAGFLQRIFGL